MSRINPEIVAHFRPNHAIREDLAPRAGQSPAARQAGRRTVIWVTSVTPKRKAAAQEQR